MQNVHWSDIISSAHTFGVETIPPLILENVMSELKRSDVDKRQEIIAKRKQRSILDAKRIASEREEKFRMDRIREFEGAKQRDAKLMQMTKWKQKLKEFDKQKAEEKKELMFLAKNESEKRSCKISFPPIVPRRSPKVEPIIPPPQALAVPVAGFPHAKKQTDKRLIRYNVNLRKAASVYSVVNY